MLYRRCSPLVRLVPFASCLSLVACAASADRENTGSSSEALSVTHVHVTATGSSVTLSYDGTADATVTLSGPGYGSSLSLSAPSPQVTFTGLDYCTPYTYSVKDVATLTVLSSGNIHTVLASGGACPASELIGPKSVRQFEGYFHWRNNAPYCTASSWMQAFGIYPQGVPGWEETNVVLVPGDLGAATVGAMNYWNAGAQPMPCEEQFVHVYRSFFQLPYLDASQLRRLASATLQGDSAPGMAPIADLTWRMVGGAIWPVTAAELQTTGETGLNWEALLTNGAPREIQKGALTCNGGPTIALQLNGGHFSADVTAQARAGALLAGGFGGINDGFPTALDGFPSDTDPSSYARDNTTTATDVTNVAIAVTYNPLPPDSPLNCSAVVTCSGAAAISPTVRATCDGAPETFSLLQQYGSGSNTYEWPIATAGGSAAASVTLSGSLLNAFAPLEVCTGAGAGTVCSTSVTTTYVSCGTSGTSSGSGAGAAGAGAGGYSPPSHGGGKPCGPNGCIMQ